MNGALREKSVYVQNACDAYNAYFLGITFGIIYQKEANTSTSMLFIRWFHVLQTEPHYTGQFGEA